MLIIIIVTFITITKPGILKVRRVGFNTVCKPVHRMRFPGSSKVAIYEVVYASHRKTD